MKYYAIVFLCFAFSMVFAQDVQDANRVNLSFSLDTAVMEGFQTFYLTLPNDPHKIENNIAPENQDVHIHLVYEMTLKRDQKSPYSVTIKLQGFCEDTKSGHKCLHVEAFVSIKNEKNGEIEELQYDLNKLDLKASEEFFGTYRKYAPEESDATPKEKVALKKDVVVKSAISASNMYRLLVIEIKSIGKKYTLASRGDGLSTLKEHEKEFTECLDIAFEDLYQKAK